MNAVNKPILRYYGGKARLAPWICKNMLQIKHSVFVDVFGGAANIALTYTLMGGMAEVIVYNDLDQGVVSFFQVLRNRGEELAEAIRLTPYSRVEHARAYLYFEEDGEVERARKYYVRSWQSFAATPGRGLQGWRNDKRARRGSRSSSEFYRMDVIERTIKLFQKIQIECLPFEKIIKMYDTKNALLYFDPPYLETERNRREHGAYVHEFTVEDHVKLAEMTHEMKGIAVVSHKPCEQYDNLYSGWNIFTVGVQNTSRTSHSERIYITPGAVVQEGLL